MAKSIKPTPAKKMKIHGQQSVMSFFRSSGTGTNISIRPTETVPTIEDEPQPGPSSGQTLSNVVREKRVENPTTKRMTLVKTILEWQRDVEFSSGWLKYESKDGIHVDSIYCRPCRENPVAAHSGIKRGGANIDVDKYITGTNVVKKYNAANHAKGQPHLRAVAAAASLIKPKKTWSIVKGLYKMDEVNKSRLHKLFYTAFHLAKEELPFTQFRPLLNLERILGVDVGETYHNDKHAREFIGVMAEMEREKLTIDLKESKYFSVLFDGSTDRSSVEKEQLYIRIIKETPQMRFLG